MPQFENATITKAANVYFDGKVTSRTLVTAEGQRVTLGVMLPGEYAFDTSEKERMEITAGDLDVLLPGADDWTKFAAGDAFEVPAGERFQLKVHAVTDYCCSYLG